MIPFATRLSAQSESSTTLDNFHSAANVKLEQLGAVEVRQKGSHKRFKSACGTCATTVAMHSGDIPKGTLRAIERDMQDCW